MIESPPSLDGAVHTTVSEVFAAVRVGVPGAPGVPKGVAAEEALEYDDAASAFLAETLNVYAVPLVRPVTLKLICELAEESTLSVRTTFRSESRAMIV